MFCVLCLPGVWIRYSVRVRKLLTGEKYAWRLWSCVGYVFPRSLFQTHSGRFWPVPGVWRSHGLLPVAWAEGLRDIIGLYTCDISLTHSPSDEPGQDTLHTSWSTEVTILCHEEKTVPVHPIQNITSFYSLFFWEKGPILWLCMLFMRTFFVHNNFIFVCPHRMVCCTSCMATVCYE